MLYWATLKIQKHINQKHVLLMHKRKNHKKTLNNPQLAKTGIPAILLLITILTGWLGAGFDIMSHKSILMLWDSFGNLLGETNFGDYNPPGNSEHIIPTFIWISRIAGLLFIGCTILVIFQELFREHLALWKIWRWQHLRSRDIYLICGLGWRGCTLAQKILDDNKNNRVVAIDKDINQGQISDLRQMGVVVFNGDATSKEVLLKAKASIAKEVFILTDSQEVNCRIAICMEQLTIEKNKMPKQVACIQKKKNFVASIDCAKCKPRNQFCYLAVDNNHYGRSLEDIVREDNEFWATRFSINELMVYELFSKQGIAPFSKSGGTHINIFGYTDVGKAILLAALQMMHFRPSQNPNRLITVYSGNPDEDRAAFYSEYPNIDPLKIDQKAKESGIIPKVNFIQLPKSEYDLLSDDLDIYQYAHQKDWRINTYFCVDDGIQSLSMLKALHEKLKYVFANNEERLNIACYYSYPETSEAYNTLPLQGITQNSNNTNEKKITVEYFGKKSSPDFYKSSEIDKLSKKVFELYTELYVDISALKAVNKKHCFIEHKWVNDNEWARHSNRMAANHIYVMRDLLQYSNQFDAFTTYVETTINTFIVKDKSLDNEERNDLLNEELMNNPLFKLMAKTAHNRWWAEKLIRGYSCITDEQMDKWNEEEKLDQEERKRKKVEDANKNKEPDITQEKWFAKLLIALGLKTKKQSGKNDEPENKVNYSAYRNYLKNTLKHRDMKSFGELDKKTQNTDGQILKAILFVKKENFSASGSSVNKLENEKV